MIYAVEESALGTGGAIRNSAEFLSGGPDASVVIFNGDVLSGHDLPGQIKAHESSNADVTLYLTFAVGFNIIVFLLQRLLTLNILDGQETGAS